MKTDVHLLSYHSVLLRMRNVPDKSCEENQTALYSNFFLLVNRAIDEVIRKNIEEPDRSLVTVWNVCIACWIPKATNTHFWNM
jgi:hypothetical protein